jgi:hypothetical protein
MSGERVSWGACLRATMLIAGSLSIIALLIGVGGLVFGPGGASGNQFRSAGEWLGFIGIVLASYFVAAAIAGTAYYLLQGLLRFYVGKMAFAFVIGGIVYGTVGVMLGVVHTLLGVNLMETASPAETWRILPAVALGCAVLSAVLGPPIWILKNRGSDPAA